MASDRRQLNVRLTAGAANLFDQLCDRIPARLGMELSQSQIVELAIRALDREYPVEEPEPRKGKK